MTEMTLWAQDPSYGSPQALKGSYQRVVDATPYDAVFPVIAFVLVIIIPTFVALWVIARVLKQRRAEIEAAEAYFRKREEQPSEA